METSPHRVNNISLYETDFYLWIETTVHQLQEGKLHEVDFNNLIEELETMGRSEKRAIESNLRIILMHLLKYKYQRENRSNSWLYSISEHRIRIKKALTDSPSLRNYYRQVFTESYQDARKLAADETGLSIETFPLESPFGIEKTLDMEFLPE